MINNNNGITLTALVVTIIALLILSGITIAVLDRDNSIINNAFKSAKETEISRIKEEVLEEWYKLEFEQSNNHIEFEDMEDLFENKLKEKYADASVEYKNNIKAFEIKYKNYTFKFTEKAKKVEIEEY